MAGNFIAGPIFAAGDTKGLRGLTALVQVADAFFQLGNYFGHRLLSLVGILGHHPLENRVKRRGYVAHCAASGGTRWFRWARTFLSCVSAAYGALPAIR